MSVAWCRRAGAVVAVSVLLAAGTAPAEAQLRTSTDPSGDVPYCYGDITSWSASFEASAATFTMTAACTANPTLHEAWVVGDSLALWGIDLGSDGILDRAVGFGHNGNNLFAEMRTADGTLVCNGTPSWNGSAYSAAFPSECVPDPFSAAAALVWDENPNGATCTCPIDDAPDGGTTFVGPIIMGEPKRVGYWMVGAHGTVYPFGEAGKYGDEIILPDTVDFEPTPTGKGYWVVDKNGRVEPKGDARRLSPRRASLAPGEEVTALSSTKTGTGYWLFTNKGRAIAFGDAGVYGDMSGTALNGPVLDAIVTPSGKGYYLVGSDGGIFTFGDAVFYGSMGATPLTKPVQSLVPDPDGVGYWLVAADGGIFAFESPFYGSMGATPLAKPVTGMVGFGNGYLMVGEDGGIFTFGEAPFFGSLGDNPPGVPIVSAAVLNQ